MFLNELFVIRWILDNGKGTFVFRLLDEKRAIFILEETLDIYHARASLWSLCMLNLLLI